MTFQLPISLAGATPMTTPPPVGTVRRGELLVDAQSRTIWLGVDASIDPAEAILISDINLTFSTIQDVYDTLLATINSGLAGKANAAHTHAISDVTGLQAALNSVSSVPPYTIIVYAGALANIPAGFVQCLGQTIPIPGGGFYVVPNLQDRFVMASGPTYPHLTVGGAFANYIPTLGGGAHSHTAVTAGWALTVAQMPYHAHAVYDPVHSHNVNDPGHVHGYQGGGYTIGNIFAGGSAGQFDNYGQFATTDQRGTGIYLSGSQSGVGIYGEGGGQAHQHGIQAEGDHVHWIQMTPPPYYALAFIMKLP